MVFKKPFSNRNEVKTKSKNKSKSKTKVKISKPIYLVFSILVFSY